MGAVEAWIEKRHEGAVQASHGSQKDRIEVDGEFSCIPRMDVRTSDTKKERDFKSNKYWSFSTGESLRYNLSFLAHCKIATCASSTKNVARL